MYFLYNLCSHLAVLTNCWELWKSCLCSLTNCFYLLTCLSSWFFPSVHVCPRLSFWSHLTACSLLPSLSQPCPSSRSSEVSETGQLHSDCSSPSSLAAATAPQHATDKVKHTHPPWTLPLFLIVVCVVPALHAPLLILNFIPGCTLHRLLVFHRNVKGTSKFPVKCIRSSSFHSVQHLWPFPLFCVDVINIICFPFQWFLLSDLVCFVFIFHCLSFQ